MNGKQQHTQAPCRASGFTLIELLIVVIIVAVLAAVAIPTYNNVIVKSRRSDAKIALAEMAEVPVYIVHLPVQFSICYFLLPRALPAYGKLTVLLVGTLALSIFLYEAVLRRVKWIRPLFGMKF